MWRSHLKNLWRILCESCPSSVIGHPTLPASERGRKCERTPSHLRTGQKNRPSSGSQRGFVPRLGPRLVCCRNLCSAHLDRYQRYSHHQPYSASREFLAEVLYSPALTGVLVPQIQLWSFLRRPLLRGFLRRPALRLLRISRRLSVVAPFRTYPIAVRQGAFPLG